MRYQLIDELAIAARLCAARELVEAGETDRAERIYQSALFQAEVLAGKKSPLTGLVLLDLYDLYEVQGKDADAAVLQTQISEIVRTNWSLFFNQPG